MDMPCDVEDDIDLLYQEEYETVLHRKKYRRREPRWKKIYEEGFLTESEFLAHFRVNKSMFFWLLGSSGNDAVLLLSMRYFLAWVPASSLITLKGQY